MFIFMENGEYFENLRVWGKLADRRSWARQVIQVYLYFRHYDVHPKKKILNYLSARPSLHGRTTAYK